jgi:2'-hydroxyisoflavone reductase
MSHLLFIGGTRFVGRHAVEAALDAGDEVTLVHRGRTGPDLFPRAEHLLADRNEGLSVLEGRSFDATIDSSAYVPRQVRALAAALGDRGGHYVHVSSVSAYASPPPASGRDEDMPIASTDSLADPDTDEVTFETYGPLKAACERAALDCFGEAVSIVRPTYVVGPYDSTYRFTYWVERLARGGRVLAPGPADNPFQAIDGRDLGMFLVALAHRGEEGAFHTVHPAPPFSFGECLELVAGAVAPPGTELVWIGPDWLEAAGIGQGDLPLWAALEEDRGLSALDPSRALAAGLAPRPLADTVRDLHGAELAEPTAPPGEVGLDPAREAALVAAFSEGRPGGA